MLTTAVIKYIYIIKKQFFILKYFQMYFIHVMAK